MGRLAIATVLAFLLLGARAAAAACDATEPSDRQAWRAELLDRTGVSAQPGGEARGWVSPEQADALLVLATRTGADGRCWVQVRLPTRPNLAKGWVDARRVQLTPTPWRIVIALRARTVTLLRAGRRVARYRAVVGAPGTPTPRGRFALLDAHPNDPGDFLGRWVVTLSAHSDVLRRFEGGDGRVALHGRGGASLRVPLGRAASHGCVRVSNGAIATVVGRIGANSIAGTPIEIES